MISFLSGTIHDKEKDHLTILTAGGVGYDVAVAPLRAADMAIGTTVSLFTYLKVTDSALDLYGFETKDERTFFLQLLTVTGVGPKNAMRILSVGTLAQIQAAIAKGDVKYLTAVQGMGKKTAERIVVELKSKLGIGTGVGLGGAGHGDVLSDVIDGLTALGYSREEAKEMVESISPDGKSVEALLREALHQKS